MALYLIPTVIAEGANHTISPQVLSVLPSINVFLAENVRTARRFLSSLKIYDSIEALTFHVLDKDTTNISEIMEPIKHQNIGVISESGCPGIADPGALAVAYAHASNIQVIPLVGPSSLLMALMASGLNGQQFVFHGYLPIDSKQVADQLRAMEKESKKKSQTQMFIETPYRNNQLFELMLKTLQKTTLLTVAIDITGKHESIRTQSVANWQSMRSQWPKEPAVFLFLA
ncbi:MAG: SAM-dependent methyltransferase [Bacteroidota bacterium]